MTTLEELVYDLSRHALAEQEAQVDDLRSRSGPLLAAGAAAAAVLAKPALGARLDLGFDWWSEHMWHPIAAVLGIAGALLAFGAALWVLVPRQGVGFFVDADRLYEAAYEDRNDPALYYRRTAATFAQRAARSTPTRFDACTTRSRSGSPVWASRS